MKHQTLAIAAFFVTTTAFADPPRLHIECGAYASSAIPTGTFVDDGTNSFTSAVGPLSAARDAAAHGGGAGAGHANGTVNYGVIKALVTSSSSYGNGIIPFVANYANGDAHSSGYFTDSITILSATLPFGAPVIIKQTVHVSGHLTRGGFYSTATLTGIAGGLGLTDNFGLSTSMSQSGGGLNSFYNESVNRLYVVHVGEVLPVFGLLDAGVASLSGPDLPYSHADIDAMNTYGQTFAVTTPGASFVSASGANYQAVPEPASLAVLGLGLAALKRRRKN